MVQQRRERRLPFRESKSWRSLCSNIQPAECFEAHEDKTWITKDIFLVIRFLNTIGTMSERCRNDVWKKSVWMRWTRLLGWRNVCDDCSHRSEFQNAQIWRQIGNSKPGQWFFHPMYPLFVIKDTTFWKSRCHGAQKSLYATQVSCRYPF